MKIRILQTEYIAWRKIKPLQPEGVKHIFNYKHIENSIKKFGFSQPFYVWAHKGEIFTIDGHTRIEVLSNMENVPDLLPATFIDASTKKEAVEILIEVYNQKQNPFDNDTLLQFIEIEEVDVDIESLNIHQDKTKMLNQYRKEDEMNEEIVVAETFPITVIADENEYEMLNRFKEKYNTKSSMACFSKILKEYYDSTFHE